MSKEYNLRFHEALKRAVEDGVEIETVIHQYRYKIIDGSLIHINCKDKEAKHPTEDINWFLKMHTDWRVIEKPRRVEFECEWKKSEFSDQTTVKDENTFLSEASKFVGKRTRVTIEEIL